MKKILYFLLAILSWSAVSPQVALAQEVDDLQEYLDQLAAQAERSRKAPTAVPLATETEIDLSRFSSYQNRTKVLTFNASLNVRITNGTITAASNFSGSTPLVEVSGTVTLDASASIDASGVSSSVCTAAVGVKGTGTFNQYAAVIAPRNGEKVTLESSSCTWNNYFDVVDPDFEGSDCLEYVYDTANKTASVKKYGSTNYSGDIVIPKKVKHNGEVYDVTSIGNEAFLYCSSLTSITIPSSVTSIGDWAFHGCHSLTSITIPSSVTSIGNDAFENCNSLTSIIIPNSVTSIGNHAFAGCSSLTSIIISNNVTSISLEAFAGCNSLISITIPNSVTSIGAAAFSSCSSLTSITIPNSVTSIGGSAFSSCSSLTSITIPNSVTSIGNHAFGSCTSLTSINVETGNTKYDSREGCNAIIESETNTLIAGCKKTVIPNSVASIGNYAFDNCSSLTSITIPSSVTSIGDNAFYYCSSLTSITIPNSVTSIGDEAFYICTSLTDVTNYATTPQNITSKVFSTYGTLHVPAGCKAAYQAADYWKNFTIVEMEDPIDFVGSDCLEYEYDTANKTASVKKYSGTEYSGDIVIPKKVKHNGEVYDVTSIGDYAFRDCSSLTSITIPNSVTSIGKYAFAYCPSLTSTTIPSSVNSIAEHAFLGCSSLTSIIIPNSVTSIDYSAFSGCKSLTSITIPNSVTSIGNSAFFNCSHLTSITIPNSVTSIGEEAFKYCGSLTSITIPNSVTSIGGEAFQFCPSLTSINIPNSVTSIGERTFFECSSLTSITIPNSVTSIGERAFLACSSLTSITIPNSVTSIGERAFSSCSSLTSINVESGNTKYDSRGGCNAIIETATNTLITGCKNTVVPNSVTSIGNDAFWDCTSLTSITIPNSVTSIGDEAFYICTSLTDVTNYATTPQNITSKVFSTYGTLHVPAGCKAAYQAADYWKNFTIVEMEDPIDFVGSDCLEYEYDTANKTASVRKYSGTKYSGDIVIPKKVKHNGEVYDVTSIGDDTFHDCYLLTSITIPNSVTSIGLRAFRYCTSLTLITIPNSVTSIGDGAFNGCSSLTSITIPNSVTSIGKDAFSNCTSLTSIAIPNSVTSIGKYAFSNCTSLTSIIVDIGNTKFDSRGECNAVIETATNTLIAGCKNTVIPNSVTSIGDYAFYFCKSLTSITIPNSVTSIGFEAFSYCSSLTSITIPNSVTSIDNGVFFDCPSLTSIIVEIGNTKYDSRGECNAIIETATNTLRSGCKNTVIPNGVTSIAEYAFLGCSSLTSITIPNSVTSISKRAFIRCESLTSIKVESGNTKYDSRGGCNAIIETATNTLITGCMNTVIPNNVTKIGEYAFFYCYSLTSITIPNSVTSIGEDAFSSCYSLTDVTNYATTPQSIAASVFSTYRTLHVPAGCKAAYEAAEGWKNFTIVEMEPEVSLEEVNNKIASAYSALTESSPVLHRMKTMYYDVKSLLSADQKKTIETYFADAEATLDNFEETYGYLAGAAYVATPDQYGELYASACELEEGLYNFYESLISKEIEMTNSFIASGQSALADRLAALKQTIINLDASVALMHANTAKADSRCGTDFFMVDSSVLKTESAEAYYLSLKQLDERVYVAKNYWNDNFSYVEISSIAELKAFLAEANDLKEKVSEASELEADVANQFNLFVQSIDEANVVLPADGVNYSLQTPSIADKQTPDGFPIQMGYKSNRGSVLTSAGVMQFERASAHTFYLKDDQGNYMILLGEDAAMLGIPSSDGATEWTGEALGNGKYLIRVAGEDFGELYLNVLGTKVNSEVVASATSAEWTIKESELDELQAFLNMMSEENYTEEDLANMDEDEKAAAEKDLVYVIPEPITDKTDKVIYIPCRPGRVIIQGYLPVPNRKDSKWGQDEHPIVVPKGSRLVLDDVKFDSENVGGDHIIHITGEVTVNVTVNIDDEWLKLWDWFFRLGTDGVLHWHPAGHRPAIKNEGGYVYIEPGSSTGKIDNTGEVLIAENTTVDEIVNKQGGTINQNGGRVVKVVNRYVYVFVGGYIDNCENGTGANFTMTGGSIGNNDVTHKDVVFVNYGKFIFRGGHIGGYGSHLFRHHPGAYLRIEGGDIDDSHVTNFIEAYDDFYMSGGFKPYKPIVINPGVRIHVINDLKYVWNIQFVGGVLPDLRVPFLVGTKLHQLSLLDWRHIGFRLPAHYRWRFRPAYRFMDDDGDGNNEEIESGALEIADENVEDEDDLQAYLDWLASQSEGASETGETTDYDYADTEDEPAVMNLPEEVMYITKYIYIPVGHHVHFKGGEIRPKTKFDEPIFHVPAGGWMHTTDVVINLLDITSDWTLFNVGGHFRFGKGSWLKGWMPSRGLYYDNAMHGHCINIGKDAHFVLDGGRIDNIVLNTETYIYLNVTLTHNLFINPDASILYKGYQLVKPYLSGFGMTIADVALMIHPNRNFAWSFGLDRYGCVALYDKINSFDYDYEVPAGWSWMSFSLPAEQTFMKSFAEQASGYAGSLMRIQDARNELIYDDVLGFVGGLESLVPEAGYHVQANSAFTMNVSSNAPLMSEDATLSIKKGWNWLGYTPQVALPVDIALSYMTPSEGDLVKTYAGGFATYHNGAWVGNLILQPGEGLMYQASADMNARYVPTRPVVNEYVPAAKVMREGWDNDVLPAQWVSPAGRYELNMSIIANIFDHEGNCLDAEDLVIGAFCGGECRGICQGSDSDLKFLTVYGDTKANELLEFKIYDKLNERVYDVYEKVAFDNKLVGTIDNPQHLTISPISTPVESVAIDAPKNEVYSIMGIRQNTTNMNSRPLPHGVYILNGKKTIIK